MGGEEQLLLGAGKAAQRYLEQRAAAQMNPGATPPPRSQRRGGVGRAFGGANAPSQYATNMKEKSRMDKSRAQRSDPQCPWVFAQDEDDGTWFYLNLETGFCHRYGREHGQKKTPPAFLTDPRFLALDKPAQKIVRSRRVATSHNKFGSTYVAFDTLQHGTPKTVDEAVELYGQVFALRDDKSGTLTYRPRSRDQRDIAKRRTSGTGYFSPAGKGRYKACPNEPKLGGVNPTKTRPKTAHEKNPHLWLLDWKLPRKVQPKFRATRPTGNHHHRLCAKFEYLTNDELNKHMVNELRRAEQRLCLLRAGTANYREAIETVGGRHDKVEPQPSVDPTRSVSTVVDPEKSESTGEPELPATELKAKAWEQYVRTLDLTRSLNDELIAQLLRKHDFEEVSFLAGEPLYQQGNPAQEMYVVRKGSVSVWKDGKMAADISDEVESASAADAANNMYVGAPELLQAWEARKKAVIKLTVALKIRDVTSRVQHHKLLMEEELDELQSFSALKSVALEAGVEPRQLGWQSVYENRRDVTVRAETAEVKAIRVGIDAFNVICESAAARQILRGCDLTVVDNQSTELAASVSANAERHDQANNSEYTRQRDFEANEGGELDSDDGELSDDRSHTEPEAPAKQRTTPRSFRVMLGPQYDRPLQSSWQSKTAEPAAVSDRTAKIAQARSRLSSEFPPESRAGRLVAAIDNFVDVESAKNDAMASTLDEHSRERLVRYKASLPTAWRGQRKMTRPATAPSLRSTASSRPATAPGRRNRSP